MRKSIKILLLSLASAMFLSSSAMLAAKFVKPTEPVMVLADDGSSSEETSSSETTSEVDEEYECFVSISELKHGTITPSIKQGHVGDVVTLTVKSDLFYLVESVSVNDVNLVESETIKGEYTFALVEGENAIKASFAVDEETLGVFSKMYDEARNKDWTNLFTVENLLTIVKWVLDGGILFVMIRYFIRDKRLADKVEKSVKEELAARIPEATKQSVVATVETVMAPIVSQLETQMVDVMSGMQMFSKVLALMQEGTPEAKVAILDALSTLKISDTSTVEDVKRYMDEILKKQQNTFQEIMEKIEEVKKSNAEIVVEEKPAEIEEPEVHHDDGTQI